MNTREEPFQQPSATKPLSNNWLVFLMVVLALATLVTAALVAWPLVNSIAARLYG